MDDAERLYACLETYYTTYEKQNNAMWVNKLGLDQFLESDVELIQELTTNLQLVETDMTIFFRLLSSMDEPNIDHLQFAFYNEESVPKEKWNQWLQAWWQRVEGNPDRKVMRSSNPKYVLRNWMAQLAIDAAEKDDYSVAEELYDLLKNPYDEQPQHEEKWFQKRPEWARHRVGCSMLSCSS